MLRKGSRFLASQLYQLIVPRFMEQLCYCDLNVINLAEIGNKNKVFERSK